MAKLNVASKSISTVETANTGRAYTALDFEQLSDSFVSRMLKWWKAIAKDSFDIDEDQWGEGYIVSIDDLPDGEDFIINNLEPDYGPFSGGISMTLGELASTLNNEHAIQFTVNAAKVEAIGKDAKLGMFKINTLLMPIEVTYLYDQAEEDTDEVALANTLALNGHIGGGRHRLTYDLTLFQVVDGWEDLKVTVIPRGFESIELQSLYILASNGSRTMTPTEKTVVQTSAAGIDIDDIDSLFESAEKQSAMWSKAAQLVAVNLWDEFMSNTELADAKLNTKGKFGSSMLTAAKKAIRFYGMDGEVDEAGKPVPNADTAPLVALLRRREVFESFMQGALGTFADNFKALKPLAKSETGGSNYARFMPNICAAIAEALVDEELLAQLEAIAKADEKAKAEAKKQREAKKVAKQQDKKKKLAKEVKEIGGIEALKALLAQAEAEEAEAADDEDEEDEEEVETVIVDEEDDDEEEEVTPPPAAQRRVTRKRR